MDAVQTCTFSLFVFRFASTVIVRVVQGYIESGKAEEGAMDDGGKTKRKELKIENTKLTAQVAERDAEIERLKQAYVALGVSVSVKFKFKHSFDFFIVVVPYLTD